MLSNSLGLGKRALQWSYTRFCDDPRAAFQELYQWLELEPTEMSFDHVPSALKPRKRVKVDPSVFDRLERAVEAAAESHCY